MPEEFKETASGQAILEEKKETAEEILENLAVLPNSIDLPILENTEEVKPKKKKKKWSKGKIITVIILAAIVSAIAFGMYQLFKPKTPEIVTGFASIGTMRNEVKGSGMAMPVEEKNIITGAKGKVLDVYVKNGDVVKMGDPLFSVDSSEFDKKINDAQKNLDEKQENVNKAAELIANLNVSAPFKGKTLDVKAKKGEFVSAGSKIATLVDDSKMKMLLYFSYAYVDDIKVGQEAIVSIPQSMASIKGKVTEIEKIRKITQDGTVLFEVTITVNNPGTLTKDMIAAASILTDKGEVMPAEASKLEYNNEIEVSAKTSGEIVEMRAKDFYEFSSGETLCVLKNDSLYTDLSRIKAEYQTTLEAMDKLKKEKDEYEAFAPIDGTIIALEIETGEELKGDTSKVAITIANLNEMVIDIQIDELDVGKLTVGMKADVYIEGQDGGMKPGMGEMIVARGMSAQEDKKYEVKNLAKTEAALKDSSIKVESDVAIAEGETNREIPEDLPMLPEGDMMPGEMMPGHMENGQMSGTLTSISLVGKGENGVSFFPGRITIKNATGIMKGMYLNYSIVTMVKENVLLIPTNGAVYTDSGMVAFVKEGSVPKDRIVELPEGQAPKGYVAIAIEVGESDGINIEVINGLEEGQEIALVGTVQDNNMNGPRYG